MFSILDKVNHWVTGKSKLWLFLDYDGTLADFPISPEMIQIQPDIISLVQQLASHARLRVTVISGRKLQDVRVLLPVEDIFLAGVYGVEIQAPAGDIIRRAEYGLIRPPLDRIKLRWEKLIAGQAGFFLEDKDWSLALHVQDVETNLARDVLSAARRNTFEILPAGLFRQFVDRNFLEVAPLQANKGETVRFLFNKFPLADAQPVFIGDDDKDIEAFEVVHTLGGINILVSDSSHPSHSPMADFILESPQAVRGWLMKLLHNS